MEGACPAFANLLGLCDPLLGLLHEHGCVSLCVGSPAEAADSS